MLKPDDKSLEIVFGGDLHEIDADLLIESLVNYSLITQETTAYLSPGAKINIKIKALSNDETEQRKQKTIQEKQELIVFKVVFQDKYKWEFVYQGRKISASIKDSNFFNKIENGAIAFRSGDRLIVELEIEQIFNEAVNSFMNSGSYCILKVIEHIPRAPVSQLSLDFEDESPLN